MKELKSEICSETFNTYHKHYYHQKDTYHKHYYHREGQHDNSNTKSCEVCSKLFATTWGLRAHVEKFHSHLFSTTKGVSDAPMKNGKDKNTIASHKSSNNSLISIEKDKDINFTQVKNKTDNNLVPKEIFTDNKYILVDDRRHNIFNEVKTNGDNKVPTVKYKFDEKLIPQEKSDSNTFCKFNAFVYF